MIPILHRRRSLLFAALGIGVALLAGAGGPGVWNRLCTEPLDVSADISLPDWMAAIKEHDGVAYPAHVALGSALGAASCSPTAVGLQWLKAGAHARSGAETGQVVEGLLVAKRLAPSVEQLESTLCWYVDRRGISPQQAAAMARAGLRCGALPPTAG